MKRIILLTSLMLLGAMAWGQVSKPSPTPVSAEPSSCPVGNLYQITPGNSGAGNIYGNSGTGTTCSLVASPGGSGTCAGDLTGTYPNCVVDQVNGAAVPAGAYGLATNGSGQLQEQNANHIFAIEFCVSTTASATVYGCTNPFLPSVAVTGQAQVVFDVINTGAATLSINGGTAYPIEKETSAGPVAIVAGDIQPLQVSTVTLVSSTYWLLSTPGTTCSARTACAAILASGGTAGTQPYNLTETPSGGNQGAAAWSLPGLPGRTVTGSTDTITEADRQNVVTYNYGSAVAVTLTSAATLGSNVSFAVINIGAGSATFTPGAGTINGAGTLVVAQGQNCAINSPDNVNYTARCASGQVTASGGVTATPSAAGTAFSLTNTATTVNGQTCTLGSTCTVTAAPNAAVNLAAGGAGGVTGILPTANGGTGAGALTGYRYANGASADTAATTIPLSGHPAQAADTAVMNATGGSAAPTAVAMPTCTTGADLYNTSTHAWSCVSTAAGTAAIWYTVLPGQPTGSTPVAGNGNANQISGYGFSPPTNVTFSTINLISGTADGSGNYSLAISDSSGNLICHPTSGAHVPTSGNLWTITCSEGTVTLTAGSVYILLNTGTAATGTVQGLGTSLIGPYAAAAVSGCSSSSGVISGTCTISLSPAVYAATRLPYAVLH